MKKKNPRLPGVVDIPFLGNAKCKLVKHHVLLVESVCVLLYMCL